MTTWTDVTLDTDWAIGPSSSGGSFINQPTDLAEVSGFTDLDLNVEYTPTGTFFISVLPAHIRVVVWGTVATGSFASFQFSVYDWSTFALLGSATLVGPTTGVNYTQVIDLTGVTAGNPIVVFMRQVGTVSTSAIAKYITVEFGVDPAPAPPVGFFFQDFHGTTETL